MLKRHLTFALFTAFLLSTSILIVDGQEAAFLQLSSCIPNDAHGTRREVWTALPKGKLKTLKSDPRYPNNPTTTDFVQSFEAPRGRGNRYGQKLSAYVIPPETGGYEFYMACDDQCELSISGDEDPSHAQSIIMISRWTPYRNWNYLPHNAQHSAPIRLTAGQLYYVEAIMAQDGGSDHLSVGTKFPSGRYDKPLSNEYLLRYAPGAYGVSTPGKWSQWSSCSTSCGVGVQVRNRTCLNPLPIFSGIDVTMETTMARSCIPYYSCPAPPTEVRAKAINSSSIEVLWSSSDITTSYMELLGYEVTYKRFYKSQSPRRLRRATNQVINKTFNHVTLSATNEGHVIVPGIYQGAVISGLSSYSTYCIQIATITNICKSEPSSCINVTTSEDVPSSPPWNVTATNLTSAYTIQVTWKSLSSGEDNGRVLGYHIRVRPLITANVEPQDSSEKIFTVLTPRVTALITGLESFTVYSIRVAAFTAIGDGPYSEPVIGETCRCPKRMFTNWWVLPPLTIRKQGMETSQGIFPSLLSKLIRHVCGLCNGHRQTTIEYDAPNPGDNNQTSLPKESQLQVKQDIKQTSHFSYPFSLENGGKVSGDGFQFVPVLEVSSGVVFIAKKISGEVYAEMLGSSVFSCWPIVVLILVLSLLAGNILFLLEVMCCPGDTTCRNMSFLRGIYEYSWCAFVSMTSVGYGDRYPRTNQGRIFTIIWFLIGYVVICVFIATLASSLSVKIVIKTRYPTQGGKIGVLLKTVEYRVATRINGTKGTHCVLYETLDEMLSDLTHGYIDGILLDVLSSNNLNKSAIAEASIGVVKAFDVTFSYGIGLSGDAIKLEQLFNEYIKNNPVSLEDETKKRESYKVAQPIEEMTSTTPSTKLQIEEKQVNFFDPNNTMYIMTVYFTSAFLIGAILSGIFFNFICNRTRLENHEKAVQFDLHCKYTLLRSRKHNAELQEILDTFYRSYTSKVHKLLFQHKEERRLLLQQLRQLRNKLQDNRPLCSIEFKKNGRCEETAI